MAEYDKDYEHVHKFFGFQVKAEFEPVDIDKVVFREDYPSSEPTQLYKRVEYLVSGCNCGRSVKSVVTQV